MGASFLLSSASQSQNYIAKETEIPAMRKSMKGLCPPGFYCMDTGTVLVCILVLLAFVAIGMAVWKELVRRDETKQPTVVVVDKTQRASPAVVLNPDPRFAPLPPEQSYESPPDSRGYNPLPAGLGPLLPINVQTRGYPDTFQQIGLLTAPGGTDNSATPTRTILPLFGRKLLTNRDRWNYYTRTDGLNPVQVPIQYKRRNCDEDNGCDEIMDGDSIGVPVMGQSYTATIYRYSTPRYLPVV